MRLWDVPPASPRPTPRGHAGPVSGIDFSPDGTMLASSGTPVASGASGLGERAARVRRRDVASRRPLGGPFATPGESVEDVDFHPDGSVLAIAGSGDVAELWDVVTRRRVGRPLPGHTGWVSAIAFSPDGGTLATGDAFGTVRLWDVGAGRQIGRPVAVHGDQVNGVAFSPDGGTLATRSIGREGAAVRAWRCPSVAAASWFPTALTPQIAAASQRSATASLGLALSPARRTSWPARERPQAESNCGTCAHAEPLGRPLAWARGRCAWAGVRVGRRGGLGWGRWDVAVVGRPCRRRALGAPAGASRASCWGWRRRGDGGTLATAGEDGAVQLAGTRRAARRWGRR